MTLMRRILVAVSGLIFVRPVSKKYKDILQDKLDDAGSGFPCCYVCGCSNNNAGTYVDFTKDEVAFVEEEPEIVGFVTQFGEDDYSYWNGFSLTDEEKKQIQEIICRHDTEGYSIRVQRKKYSKTYLLRKIL